MSTLRAVRSAAARLGATVDLGSSGISVDAPPGMAFCSNGESCIAEPFDLVGDSRAAAYAEILVRLSGGIEPE